MISRFQLPIRAASAGYRLVTGKPLTAASAEVSRSFFRLISKLFIAKALVLVSTILAGKFLGAEQFGSLALILAIGNFWCLPFFTSWGLAYVNFASGARGEQLAGEYLNCAFAASIISVGVWMPFLLLFKKWLAEMVNVTPDIWILGCVFGVLMGGYYFSKSIFQASQKWSFFATCELLFAFSLATGILVLYLVEPARRFGATVAVFVLAHLAGVLPAHGVVYRTFRLPKSENLLKVGRYGFGLIISFGLSLIAMQLDKLFLNHYASSEAVGRYQAYYVSTFGLLSGFTIILNNYLLPLYGKHSKKTLKDMLIRFLLVTSVPLCLCCLVLGRLAFFVFGKSFGFDWLELVWASAFNVVMFWLQVVVFFSMTLGKRALLCNSAVYVVFIIAQLITMPFLIQKSGVSGAFQGMTAATAVALCILLRILPSLSNQGGRSE